MTGAHVVAFGCACERRRAWDIISCGSGVGARCSVTELCHLRLSLLMWPSAMSATASCLQAVRKLADSKKLESQLNSDWSGKE